jgi:integrase
VTDDRTRLPKGIERNGNGYRGAYYDGDGVRHKTRTQSSVDLALSDLRRAWGEVERGGHVPPERRRITLDDWWKLWSAQRSVRASTAYADARRYRLHIAPNLGKLRLAEITPHKVQAWLRWAEDHDRSASTRAKALTLLGTMLGPHGAIADRRLSVNPCDGIKKPVVDVPRWEIPARGEVEAIIGALPEGWRPYVMCAAYTGMRWSELCGLQRRDYNPMRAELRVARAVTYTPGRGYVIAPPKSGKGRTVPVHRDLGAVLDARVPDLAPDGFVFTIGGRKGSAHPHASNFYRDAWTPALTAVGVSYRFHDLRHYTATTLISAGVDLATVMEIMGHASITTTQRYLHVSQEQKHAAVLRAFG